MGGHLGFVRDYIIDWQESEFTEVTGLRFLESVLVLLTR